MKKIITGALALTVLSTMTMAEGMGLYVGGGIVYEEVEDATNAGQAFEFHVGKEIANNFGAELRVSKTFNEANLKNNQVIGEYDITTLGAFGTYTYSPISQLSIVPKIGLNYLSVKSTIKALGYTEQATETKLAYGLDVKYNINSNLSTYIGITQVGPQIQHLTIGVESHF